jgi:type IV pilus assembly protein PilC
MSLFSYKARNDKGELISGSVEAESEQQAIAQIRQLNCTPVKITEDATKVKKAAPNFLSIKILSISTPVRVKMRDMVVFCTNLSSMTSAGIPLLNALTVCGEQLTNPTLAATVRRVSQVVSDGSSFSEALALFPNVFSNFFVNMIRAAETSGTLDQVLKEMAVYMEKEDNLIQTIKGMMVYPTVLVIASIGVVLLIITVVMPQFVQIFTKAGVPLPLPTKILYETGIWVKKYPLFYFPLLALIIFQGKRYFKTKNGKDLWDRFSLNLPVVGPVINNTLVARFCRTLATMLNTGVPLLQSFRIVQNVLDHVVFTKIIDNVYTSVEKGETINQVLSNYREFPRDVTYMISVGEKTGNMGLMLNKIADFYENKVQFEVKNLMLLIEPTFVAVMGVVVGGILASMILPMFDMVKTIHR